MFMTRPRDWSLIFWVLMLPTSWLLAAALTLLAHAGIGVAQITDADRLFQSTVFMAVFLSAFGLMGVRVLMGRAIAEDRAGRACLLGVGTLVASTVLIIYGLSKYV